MNYGIPTLPATGGGIFLTTLGFHHGNYIVLILGIVLLAVALLSHINLRRNEG